MWWLIVLYAAVGAAIVEIISLYATQRPDRWWQYAVALLLWPLVVLLFCYFVIEQWSGNQND